MSVKWLIGRKRPGAGRPVTICRSPANPSTLPSIPMRCTVWLVGSNNTDVYGLRIRGIPHGSWILYQGRIFRKKRIYRKRTDSDSERELGIESEQWRDRMQEDPDAFLEACFEDPELMKKLFPALWRQRIGDDGYTKEVALQDPGDLIESMDEDDLKEQYPELWKKRYGKKQSIESDGYWDDKKDIDADR